MNLLTTMLLGGFWHGASWNFLIWGGLHGIALALHKIWLQVTGKRLAGISNRKWYNAIAVLITFHFVCFCWIFFHAPDFNSALTMIHQITRDFSLSVWKGFVANYWPVLVMMGGAYCLHAIPDSLPDKLVERFRRLPLAAYLGIFFAFVFLYGYFKSAEPVMPIYLQF